MGVLLAKGQYVCSSRPAFIYNTWLTFLAALAPGEPIHSIRCQLWSSARLTTRRTLVGGPAPRHPPYIFHAPCRPSGPIYLLLMRDKALLAARDCRRGAGCRDEARQRGLGTAALWELWAARPAPELLQHWQQATYSISLEGRREENVGFWQYRGGCTWIGWQCQCQPLVCDPSKPQSLRSIFTHFNRHLSAPSSQDMSDEKRARSGLK